MISGDLSGTLAEIDQALAGEPRDKGALDVKCQLLFEHGQPPEAEAALRALIEHYPSDASAYHNLGLLLLRLGRYEEATRSLRQSLRYRAASPATYYHLGVALRECNRTGEAIAVWQQVLRLAPDHALARDELKKASMMMRRASIEPVSAK
jgi:tetratricopeptide (TPR) repeat protein